VLFRWEVFIDKLVAFAILRRFFMKGFFEDTDRIRIGSRIVNILGCPITEIRISCIFDGEYIRTEEIGMLLNEKRINLGKGRRLKSDGFTFLRLSGSNSN